MISKTFIFIFIILMVISFTEFQMLTSEYGFSLSLSISIFLSLSFGHFFLLHPPHHYSRPVPEIHAWHVMPEPFFSSFPSFIGSATLVFCEPCESLNSNTMVTEHRFKACT